MKITKSTRTVSLLIVGIGLAVNGYSQPFLTNGLVAYYPFNGNGSDESGGGDNGVVNGALLTQDRFGNSNRAYYFDRLTQDNIALSGTNLSRGFHEVSFTYWFRQSSNIVGESLHAPMLYVGTGNSAQPYFKVEFWITSLQIVQNSGGYKSYDNPAQEFTDGAWHHLACCITSNGVLAYVDGTSLSTWVEVPPAGTTWPIPQGSIWIGYAPSNYYDGLLDDIRIYNRALSSNEVQQLYVIEGTPPPPIITTQPQSIITNLAASVHFTVNATGTNGVWYQWRKDGVNLPNATNNTYDITNVQPPYIGNYEVVVMGYGGSVTSSVVSLSLNGVNSGIWQGLVAYYPFNGNANDASPFEHHGSNNAVTWGLDRYEHASKCAVFNTNRLASITVAHPTLPVGNSPRTFSFWYSFPDHGDITVGAANVFMSYGDNGVIGVSEAGKQLWVKLSDSLLYLMTPYNAYFWYDNRFSAPWAHVVITMSNNIVTSYYNGANKGQAIVQTTNYPINTNPGTDLLLGRYRTDRLAGYLDDIRIYNRSLSSNEVSQLYASEAVPPSIRTQPIAQVVNAFDPVTFTVTASGTPPLTYQWRFDGTNLHSASNDYYSIASVQQTNLGDYSCVVSNIAGRATSSSVGLYMYPYITMPFSGAVGYWGRSVTLNVGAWGSDLDYQWYCNDEAISGATSSSFTLSSIQMTNAGLYSVVISSFFGSVTNTAAQVVVNPAGVTLSLNPDLIIEGTVGYIYNIQCSTNLPDINAWTTLTNLTLTQPTQYWDDTSSQWNHVQRYYRVLPGQ